MSTVGPWSALEQIDTLDTPPPVTATIGPWSDLVSVNVFEAPKGVVGPWSSLVPIEATPATSTFWLTTEGWIPMEKISL